MHKVLSSHQRACEIHNTFHCVLKVFEQEIVNFPIIERDFDACDLTPVFEHLRYFAPIVAEAFELRGWEFHCDCRALVQFAGHTILVRLRKIIQDLKLIMWKL